MHFETVAVVGAGTMGAGIAQVFAQGGYRVLMIDTMPAALAGGVQRIEASLGKLAQKGAMTEEEARAARERLSTAGELEAASAAGLVVEAVVEQAEVKGLVLGRLGEICPPETLLASNTSSISITELGRASGRPERFAGMHFMNPVPLMKLVEVIRGQRTDSRTMELIVETCRHLGKTPVEASDYPGFLSNRILMPMINEAVFTLMEGVGTPEAIDTVMKLGMNHPMGPLALADLIGLDVCLNIMEVLHEGLGDKYRPCPLLRRMVAAGQLGRKSGSGFYTYGR